MSTAPMRSCALGAQSRARTRPQPLLLLPPPPPRPPPPPTAATLGRAAGARTTTWRMHSCAACAQPLARSRPPPLRQGSSSSMKRTRTAPQQSPPPLQQRPLLVLQQDASRGRASSARSSTRPMRLSVTPAMALTRTCGAGEPAPAALSSGEMSPHAQTKRPRHSGMARIQNI